jgi:16S rRNA (adenine1518-N6/adenine1519-N6)-dimethyltransferase
VISSRGLRLRKKLGQHFLIDCDLANEMISHLTALQPKYVVEIGTGLGSLTMFIARSFPVVSIEIDPTLMKLAYRILRRNKQAHLVLADGLNTLQRSFVYADVVVSNTPYSITGPFLISLIKSNYKAAVLTLQKEVALRLAALPGTKNYSRLTVIVGSFMHVHLGKIYSPDSFYPPPKVESQVVVLKRYRNWNDCWLKYEEMLRCLFSYRRRKASKIIRKCIPELSSNSYIMSKIKEKRIFQLSIDDFLSIFHAARDEDHPKK